MQSILYSDRLIGVETKKQFSIAKINNRHIEKNCRFDSSIVQLKEPLGRNSVVASSNPVESMKIFSVYKVGI